VKKKVVFRVIGSQSVGMGHIYRALSLAKELDECDIFFLSDAASDLAIRYLSDERGWLGAYPDNQIVPRILDSNPDLVIFDALDTDAEIILALRKNGLEVVSFEDLGDGSEYTSLTINELFDTPERDGKHYRWGKDFFFVRDEFLEVVPRSKPEKIKNLLLTFGGVDQHDLSRKILLKVHQFCRRHGIYIHVVTGPGYLRYSTLKHVVQDWDGVTLTHATGVISRIMAEVDLSISSNGRTVYELAHMNVPGIVIDQHPREGTHNFACPINGFVNLGLYDPGVTESKVLETLESLVASYDQYERLYEKLLPHNFSKTTSKGITEIKMLLV